MHKALTATQIEGFPVRKGKVRDIYDLGDRLDGQAFQEDMWTPGVFEMTLEPGKTVHLVTAVGKPPEQKPADIVAESREFLRRQDMAAKRSPAVRVLGVAAEQFLVESGGGLCSSVSLA